MPPKKVNFEYYFTSQLVCLGWRNGTLRQKKYHDSKAIIIIITTLTNMECLKTQQRGIEIIKKLVARPD